MWHTQRGLLFAARMLLSCRSAALSGTTPSGPCRFSQRGPFFNYAVARREAGPVRAIMVPPREADVPVRRAVERPTLRFSPWRGPLVVPPALHRAMLGAAARSCSYS